jgi:hypothetical protein
MLRSKESSFRVTEVNTRVSYIKKRNMERES